MFKPRDVARIKLSNLWSMSWILGMGKGCLFISLLISLLSVNDLRVPSGFAIVKAGDTHLEVFTFSSP